MTSLLDAAIAKLRRFRPMSRTVSAAGCFTNSRTTSSGARRSTLRKICSPSSPLKRVPTEPPAGSPTSIQTGCEVARDSALWAAFGDLPEPAQDAARKAYRLFRENPNHPSLQFKKIHTREPIYSVRVTLGYRAVGLLEADEIIWFWIGSHADYDRLVKAL